MNKKKRQQKVTVVLNQQEWKSRDAISAVFNGTVKQAIQHIVKEFMRDDDGCLTGKKLSKQEVTEIVLEQYYFESMKVEELA